MVIISFATFCAKVPFKPSANAQCAAGLTIATRPSLGTASSSRICCASPSALKVAGIAGTGGQAKILIKSDEIKVNGEICNVVRKKLYVGDCFSFEGKLFEIKNEGTV